MFNTTTILRMVIMSVETGIETIGTDYRSEQRIIDKSIAFRRDDKIESMLLEETDGIFCPVSTVGM